MSLLDVEGLKVSYSLGDDSALQAVDDISFELQKGELIGIAGESGCGKTTTVNAMMRILPPTAQVNGKIYLDDVDLLKLSEKEMRKVQWGDISIVFQDAQEALNPIRTIEDQIAEPIILHLNYKRQQAIQRARELLELVGVKSHRGKDFPHQLSGGMKQRAVIAMALACKAKIVIADEPTTALDVMVQAQILNLLKELKQEYSLSLIYISHDLSVLAGLCERLIIMYAGQIAETALTEGIFDHPYHPYTRKLLEAIPTIEKSSEGRLATIPGAPPRLVNPSPRCRFFDRCPQKKPHCDKEIPSLVKVAPHHFVACFEHQKGEDD